MEEFNFGVFKKALDEFFALKEKYSPYDYRAWTTSKTRENTPAAQCRGILERMRKELKAFVSGMRPLPNVRPSHGAAYFPRHPWIALLFGKKNKPTDGIYPALGLSEHGMIVGCVESIGRLQPQFAKLRLDEKAIDKVDDAILRSLLNTHLSRNYKWFPKDGQITEETFRRALLQSVDDYMECRNKREGRENGEHWFPIKRVSSVENWLSSVGMLEGHWIFRGQASSKWHLESGMERAQSLNTDDREIDVDNARQYENEILQEFRREVARKPEYSGFSDVDLMSVMQHYGSKTRLLDFTFSPLVALYMAMEQYEKDFTERKDEEKEEVSMAVWAIDADKLALPSLPDDESDERDNAIIRKSKTTPNQLKWWEKCRLWHLDAQRIFHSDSLTVGPNGVDVLLPNANNERSSAQEGLFLVNRSLKESFENNLRDSFIDGESGSEALGKDLVVQYIFPPNSFQDIKRCLRRLCITPKLVYPDLSGLAKSMNAKLDFGREEEKRA